MQNLNQPIMKCAIVDDDKASRLSVIKCINRLSDIELLAEFENPIKALAEINKMDLDVIFLDVEMPELTGLEFINGLQTKTQIVLISSKADYAAEAFNYNVSDYITKPITFERFCKSIEKIRAIENAVQRKPSDFGNLFVKVDSKLIKIGLDEIQYIEALSDYIAIHTQKGRFVILGTMKAMINKLDGNNFVRVHRSYIVNLNSIESIQSDTINIGEQAIPISRKSKDDLMSKINLLN